MQKQTLWESIGDFKVSNIMLGKGQSCQVFYAINIKTGQKVAAKRINMNKLNSKLQKQLENEIKNLTKLTSPFIVRLLGSIRYQKQPDKQNYLYLFLQYCLSESQALLFLRHIIEGYHQLHKNNIIHRDIKPANILLKQGVAKLSDFGFSRVVQDPQTPDKFTLLGTPLYTAPQILQAGEFSSKCDVWSVGVLFYELLYGRTPWTGTDLPDLRSNILKKPLQFSDANRKPQLKQLIKKMLKTNPNERISWPQIFEYHLFKQQLPKIVNKQSFNYGDYKKIFLQYLKKNIVKSYLRFNMDSVTFKDSTQPTQQGKKQAQISGEISNVLTHQRNVAFLFAYMLALYYNNIDIIPKSVNQGMQFEYALAKKAYKKISQLGSTYISKQPTNYPKQIWKIFQQSHQYDQLCKILNQDYKCLQNLLQQITNEVQKNYKKGNLKPEIVELIKNIDKEGVFEQILIKNKDQFLKKSKTGVCGLLANYVDLALNLKQIEDSQNLQFGQFYENRERQYGLQ